MNVLQDESVLLVKADGGRKVKKERGDQTAVGLMGNVVPLEGWLALKQHLI